MARGGRERRGDGRRRSLPAPLELGGLVTYPLARRRSKVSVRDFARPHRRGEGLTRFLDGLPRILAGETLRVLRDEILRAHARRRPILWGLGAHVLKVGLSPVLLDLMERGFVSGIAMNGAGVVHDFELAVVGRTSEDVEATLGTGAFAPPPRWGGRPTSTSGSSPPRCRASGAGASTSTWARR